MVIGGDMIYGGWNIVIILGVFKCFRIATIHPPEFPLKSRKSSSEMFQKSTTEQLREDMMWE